ncbi:MAG TPA: hypothetical protein VJN18_15080 [Polyangiaceae bacterium]|nr:hypothetical protein [Polyangiaceae bacterium]
MLVQVSSLGTTWLGRNQQLLTWFAPLLILTGLLGFVLPAEKSLMSGATPYNVFHLIAGAIGLAIVLLRRGSAAILFNLVFGVIDLYQALAGMSGWFPAGLFELRPADHVVHVVIGLLLVVVGALGKATSLP